MANPLYRLERSQVLPCSLEECWRFFSNPGNLPLITPGWLQFTLLVDPLRDRDLSAIVASNRMRSDGRPFPSEGSAIFPGQIFTYRIRPMLGVPIHWITEITHVEPPVLFVDEQRFGPYRIWHHVHGFRALEEGVEVIDRVDYMLPWGPLGRVVHRLVVRRKLERIFDFRRQTLEGLFPSLGVAGAPRGSMAAEAS